MKLFKLLPVYKDYIWGGSKLKERYGKQTAPARTAESWELSCHPDGKSTISGGAYAGKTLASVVAANRELLGSNCSAYEDFPIMVKLLDTKENLSVQVHPDDAFSRRHEGQPGKTEMWYILEHEDNACLYYGLKKKISREAFAACLQDGSVLTLLNKVYVKPGDVFFIEPGTVHAIGQGIVLAEIQQSANVTYRLYDYGRLADGKPRALHIEKGLACAVLEPPRTHKPLKGFLTTCAYFSVMARAISGKGSGCAGKDSFHSLFVTDGSGLLHCGEERVAFAKGDSLFVAAGAGRYEMEGHCRMLVTFVGMPGL